MGKHITDAAIRAHMLKITAKGRAAAMGLQGRKPMFTAKEIHIIRRMRAEGALLREIAAAFNCSTATISRICNGT